MHHWPLQSLKKETLHCDLRWARLILSFPNEQKWHMRWRNPWVTPVFSWPRAQFSQEVAVTDVLNQGCRYRSVSPSQRFEIERPSVPFPAVAQVWTGSFKSPLSDVSAAASMSCFLTASKCFLFFFFLWAAAASWSCDSLTVNAEPQRAVKHSVSTLRLQLSGFYFGNVSL